MTDEKPPLVLPKTVMLNPEDWGPVPPLGHEPLDAAPFAEAPNPFAQPVQQPYAAPGSQPGVAQHAHPVAAPAQAAPPKKKSNLVVFLASAVAVFSISGLCVGGVVLYLLFNR